MGAAATVDVVTKEQCQDMYRDLFDEGEWEKQAVDGVVSREKLAAVLSTLTDAFLTHDWGTDGGTHKKVSVINQLLKARGITTWFDEEKMEGNVKKQMIHGIDNARVIVVFVTHRYMTKVGGSNAEDNCQLEFNYAARRKTASRMIPVLIDPTPSLKNPATWTGEVGFVLGGHLYLDLSGAFDNDQLLASKVDELVAKIVSIGGPPLAQRFPPPSSPPPAEAKASDVSAAPVAASPRATVPSVPTVALASLTKEEVAGLLSSLACSKFIAAFLENEVTGEVLFGAASVEEIKELGVPLAAKARVLFDKIAEFKSHGVPVSLLRDESKATSDAGVAPASAPPVATVSDASATPASTPPVATVSTTPSAKAPPKAFKSFEELKAAFLPPDWAPLYKYKLQVNGANSLSSHALTWFDASSSLSVENGFFSKPTYGRDVVQNTREAGIAMRLETLGGLLDKQEFLLRFRMRPLQGGVTALAGGSKPWFAVDITADLYLALSCNQGSDTFVVEKDGKPVAVVLDAWVDVVVLVHVRTASAIQVFLDSEAMDPITVAAGFELHIPSNRNPSTRATVENLMYLFRLNTTQGLFHGYLRDIELYSSRPSSRPLPDLTDAGDPTRHSLHAKQQSELVHGLRLAAHYPDMGVDVVDTVTGKPMALPRASHVRPSVGAVFDGDYYGDTDLDRTVVLAGRLGPSAAKDNIAVSVTFAPLAPCWVVCMGLSYRWFGVNLNDQMNLTVSFNNQDVRFVVQRQGVAVTVCQDKWHDVTVRVARRRVTVILDGDRMDDIELPEKFKYSAPPDQDNTVHLLNYSCGGCFHGVMKQLAVWTS